MPRKQLLSMYLSMLGFWTAICLVWAVAFQTSLTFDVSRGLQQAFATTTGNEYLQLKVAVGIISIGLVTGFVKLKHCRSMGRLILLFGFCLLLMPFLWIPLTIETDSKFLQFMVPLVGMTIPMASAVFVTDIILPKNQSK